MARRILIIDDDKHWLRVISGFFSLQNYEVHSAADAAEGLKLAELARPDCILLDFHLSDRDADEFCRELRTRSSMSRTPVVIMSNDDAMDAAAYTECGAVSFVMKMGPLGKILSAVENVLRHVDMSMGVLEKGDIRLELDGCRVLKDSRPLPQLTVEQFRFLSLLVKNSPKFVPEDYIAKYVFDADASEEKSDAIRGLVQRLRKAVGPCLGGRIKSKARQGWIYLESVPAEGLFSEAD